MYLPISTVTYGKYKGQLYTDVPQQYAEFMRRVNNKQFYTNWLVNQRFVLHTHFKSGTSPDGRWFERKLDTGEITLL